MSEILAVLTQNILPIAIVAGFGYLLQRRARLDKRVLSNVVLTILSPALVFSSLVESKLTSSELGNLAAFTVLVIAANGILAFLVARLLRFSRQETALFMIVIMFVNGGNYGMTLNKLRYGEDGLSRAVVYYLVSTLLVYSAGIFISSLGSLNWRSALRSMATLPAFYAAFAAVVVYALRIPIPSPVMTAVDLAAQAAIPVMLLVLGMQIADLGPGGENHIVWPAVGLRLLVGPFIAVGVAALLGLTGLDRSVSIIEASMPTAVITIILAAEFGLPSSPVARIVVFSTLISPITVALTITLPGL